MKAERPDFFHLSLEDMDNMKVEFGKQQLGKKFIDVWKNEQSWILWFTQHYENSNKRAPDPAPLHRTQGGSCRESPGSARDQSPIVVGQAAKSDDPGPAKGDAQDVCHAQDDSPKRHHDSRPRDPSGDGSLGSRPRFRPLRTHPGTGECDHSEQSRAQGSTDHQSGTTALPDGECLVPSDPIHREPAGEPGEPDLRECPSQMAIHEAGDVSADCHYTGNFTAECNQERRRLWNLVHQYSQELKECQRSNQDRTQFSPKLSLLEVFCGADSQLTNQSTQLGYRASRFGKHQGDLQTVSGRSALFHTLLFGRPDNAWFSPSCGPWAGFSNLNGSKSIEAWDALQQLRYKHLEQIALGIVLFRHQRQHGKHLHWEQPRGSLMFKLPYLQEVFHYMLAVDVDLCVAGNLQDPTTQKPIRKTLTILSSSAILVKELTGLRCPGHHEHQVIEGQVKVKGQWMNRSTFTENYPRKFARKIAIILGKIPIVHELPYKNEEASTFAADHPDAPRPKRPRLSAATRLKASRSRPVSTFTWGKRRKMTGKTEPVDSKQQWEEVFEQLQKMLPRVGKKEVTDPTMLSQIQELVTEKAVVAVVACRGTNRTLGPPSNLIKGEAPYRRAVFTERGTKELRAEEEWEEWEELAKRNVIRTSHSCHINMTIFAKNVESSGTQSSAADVRVPENVPVEPDVQVPPNSEEIPEQREATVPEDVTKTNATFQCPLTPSQEDDLQNEKQSKRFKALAKDEQQLIIRSHKNLGHVSPERLSTILRNQGFRAEVAQAALELRCSVCQAQSQPKIARPSAVRDELDFNDRICTDHVSWTNKHGQTFSMYHVVDWATSFQVACSAPDKSTSAYIHHLLSMWFAWAGSPREMIVDAASEFNSEEFSHFAQAHNIHVTTISTEVPKR